LALRRWWALSNEKFIIYQSFGERIPAPNIVQHIHTDEGLETIIPFDEAVLVCLKPFGCVSHGILGSTGLHTPAACSLTMYYDWFH